MGRFDRDMRQLSIQSFDLLMQAMQMIAGMREVEDRLVAAINLLAQDHGDEAREAAEQATEAQTAIEDIQAELVEKVQRFSENAHRMKAKWT